MTAHGSVMATYPRSDVTFVSGQGSWLVDADGNRCLDCLGGLAVIALGHCNPIVAQAAHEQLDRLWHASNLYWTEPMETLAERLSARFGGASSFFCNSGAEANEAALKYARKATGKPGVVALEGGFHGRTLGALSVTGQPAKRVPFEPLSPGATFVAPNDIEALVAAVGPDTGCILLEPILGEGGVHPLTPEFLGAARALADEDGAVLILDEIQCGMGRTGSFFAFEQLDVRPDAITLAKALANGLPIGALVVANDAPEGFAFGDHGSTFGGSPVPCAAAVAVCDALTDELLADVRDKGAILAAGLATLPGVTELRGRGLMIGLELDRPAGPIVAAARARGLVVGTAGDTVLRLTPPLTITTEELGLALGVLQEVLQ